MTNSNQIVDSEVQTIQVVSCSDSSLFGWLIASMLAKALRHNRTRIKHSIVYRSKSEFALGYKANNAQGLTLSPDLLLTLTKLGLSESTLRAHASANYHLADEFINWHHAQGKTLVGISPTGVNFEGVKFVHYWALAKEAMADIGAFSDFSFNNVCAGLGKFKHPIADSRSVLSTLEYGLSVDGNELHSLLREAALALGVNEEFLADKSLGTKLKSKADVLFDCRENTTLSQKNSDTYRLAVTHSLAIETPNCLQLDSASPLDLATQYCALDDGYLISRRVNNHYNHRLFYHAEVTDVERFIKQLSTVLNISEKSLSRDIKSRSEVVGDSCAPYWYSNEQAKQVVSLPQTGMFNLISDGGLSFAAQTVDEWLKRMPRKTGNELLVQHFNRTLQAYFDSAFELSMLKVYAANKRETPFWHNANTLDLSDNIQHFITLFKKTGVFPTFEFYPQELDYYENLLVGLGHAPEHCDPIGQQMPQAVLFSQLKQLRHQLINTAKGLPEHASPQTHEVTKALSTH